MLLKRKESTNSVYFYHLPPFTQPSKGSRESFICLKEEKRPYSLQSLIQLSSVDFGKLNPLQIQGQISHGELG
jgi:hypothetical protein